MASVPMVKSGFAISLLVVLVFLAGVVQRVQSADGRPLVMVSGGGTGTFGADLDGDGDVDGSQFAIGVSLWAVGSARGHFECLMAGRSDFLGLRLMAVSGMVSSGSLNEDGTVTIAGSGMVNLANGDVFRDVPFKVTLRPGGPGVGSLTLTVVGAFEGVPGDTVSGNGNYDLPIEMLSTGRIALM